MPRRRLPRDFGTRLAPESACDPKGIWHPGLKAYLSVSEVKRGAETRMNALDSLSPTERQLVKAYCDTIDKIDTLLWNYGRSGKPKDRKDLLTAIYRATYKGVKF